MGAISYNKLKVLIADDFSSFRNTVKGMLTELGVENVLMANSAEAIIEQCEQHRFDVILCDYNLGSGRNGQHVLEELRFRKLLHSRSVFILVSAEAGRNIVMSAYDSAPDDYLMKPITAKMLQGRLRRLLDARTAFAPVHQALESGKQDKATELLIEMSLDEGRNVSAAQKMLGELFLQQGEYRKAEKLYKRVLEGRELDWARLGLARSKHLMGDHEQAGQWLEQIIESNYLFLPAYDVLSENHLAKGDAVKAQEVTQQSVDVSPMSILRQKNLAKLARQNKARDVALEAMRKVVRLGKLSCYGEPSDKLELARCVSDAIEHGCDVSVALYTEAAELLKQHDKDLDFAQSAQLMYINSRMLMAKGEIEAAKAQVVEAERRLLVEDSQIDIEVDHVRALLCLNYKQKSDDLLKRLQELYSDDQVALQKLDEFLAEPASEANKAMVAEVNREGIELYKNNRHDEALACFDKALQLFPKHVGLQLNVVQALIGKLKQDAGDDKLQQQCRQSLETIAVQIDNEHPQHSRFMQLKTMAASLG